MRILIPLVLITLWVAPVHADFWGGDDLVLAQILQQEIQELIQLKGLLSNAQDSYGLLQSVNAGINDSINFLHLIAPNLDPGIYQKLANVQTALGAVESIYGGAVPSSEYTVQTDTDTEVAEAITLHNSMFDYSKDLDTIGDEINQVTQSASPGRAQQLTAHTLGVMLHAMSASNRIQSTTLKLQAQALEVQNHKDKESSRMSMKMSDDLEKEMSNAQIDFNLPRF